jgi:hypothetical protein
MARLQDQNPKHQDMVIEWAAALTRSLLGTACSGSSRNNLLSFRGAIDALERAEAERCAVQLSEGPTTNTSWWRELKLEGPGKQ